MLHRFWLHKKSGHAHLSDHHKNYHGKGNFEHSNSKWSDIASSNVYILVNVLLWMPAVWAFSKMSLMEGAVFAAVAFAYTMWVEVIHFYIHSPRGNLLEKTPIYIWLKENHRLHHIHYDRNFGIGSAIWDWVLGTRYKKIAGEEE